MDEPKSKVIADNEDKLMEKTFGGVSVPPLDKKEKLGIKEELVDDGEYKVNIIKDYDQNIDPTYLSSKDPNYEYRWLLDKRENMSLKTGNLLFQKGGWQVCAKEFLIKHLKLREVELAADGHLRRGELILAFMPKKLYLEKEEFKIKKANAPMDAIQRLIKKGDPDNPELAGLGGSEKQKGLQTDKDLGMG